MAEVSAGCACSTDRWESARESPLNGLGGREDVLIREVHSEVQDPVTCGRLRRRVPRDTRNRQFGQMNSGNTKGGLYPNVGGHT